MAPLLVRDKDLHPLGVVQVQVCTSRDHEPRVAVATVHWVDGPTAKCPECAAKLVGIGRVLGTHVHVEPIQYPEWTALLERRTEGRGMRLGGAKE